MKSGFVDKLVDRLDKLDPGSLQTQFLHLVKEKGLLETIFHAIQEGIIVVDGQGVITYANRAAETLCGFSLDRALQQPIQRFIKEIDWASILELDEEEWSRLVTREIEISYPEQRFIEFYLVPLSAVNEDEEGAVVILRDVTREREAQAASMESERLQAITLLAAGVAHEIGNPLNSLTINLQLLEREFQHLSPEDRENLNELVDVSRKEVDRLDSIITQFLRAVRPQQPQVEPIDPVELLRESLTFLRQEVQDRGVLVEVEADESIPAIQIDPGQVKQAFFNIIKNAVQAMAGGGVLKIAVFVTERFVAISFKDTGCGIKPEDLSSIFKPYHTTKSEGSGLGLMIVQRIMRDHGGEIEVDSEPEKGTSFTLLFPRDDRRIRLLRAHGAGEAGAESEGAMSP